MSKERENAFDILRIIAMTMVIIIHVSNIYSRSFGTISNNSYLFSLIFNTISRISVPIFFMISGALLLDRKLNKKSYIDRLIKYVIVIIVWNLIYLVWEYFYLGIKYEKLYMLLFGPYRAHLWFLYTILILYFLQPIIRKILSKLNNKAKIILLVLWFFFCSISMISTFVAKYFTIFNYIGFFILGKYIYDYCKKKELKKYNILLILLMVTAYFISIVLNYQTSLKYQMFYNLYFAYKTPFIVIAAISFYILIITNFKKIKLTKRVLKLSDLSLGVYLIHGTYLDITNKMFSYKNIHSLLGIPLFTIMIFISSVITVYLLRKIKLLKNLL